jgi:regulator of RNase E activity RraA
VALIESDHDAAIKVEGHAAALRLSGRAHRVAWARHCPTALVSLAGHGLVLVDLRQTDAVKLTPVANHARLAADTIDFDRAPVLAHARCGFPDLHQPVLTLGAMARKSGQADIEAHNLAKPGDVLVIEGVEHISSLGGNSANVGKRQGEAGAIVDGATRDVATARSIGYPIWARGVSLMTGKWSVETVAINGPVQICGVPVNAGDLVVADDNGVCFIPRARIAEVLTRAQALSAGEEERNRDVAAGMSVVDVANKAYFKKIGN